MCSMVGLHPVTSHPRVTIQGSTVKAVESRVLERPCQAVVMLLRRILLTSATVPQHPHVPNLGDGVTRYIPWVCTAV